jgi:hypothetical protein
MLTEVAKQVLLAAGQEKIGAEIFRLDFKGAQAL